MKEIQSAFRLKRDLPLLPKGVIFVVNNEKFPIGAYLAWDNGNCQANWCGGAFRLPYRVLESGWFEEIVNDGRYFYKLTRTTRTFEVITD